MTNEGILAQLNIIFREVLDLPDLILTPATTASDVPGWDSLTHVQLVVAVEKQFGMRFTAKEIRSFANVGDMCAVIQHKKG